MKKLKIIIIVLLLLIVCLLAKNTQYHSQIIEKDSQIEKLKQENKSLQNIIERIKIFFRNILLKGNSTFKDLAIQKVKD